MSNRGPRNLFKPEAGELFNAIVSIQYRASKCDDYKNVSLSSIEGAERAIRDLRLEEDLARMGLPRLKGADCVNRSSFDNPFTIEIIFPDCEAGQVLVHETITGLDILRTLQMLAL